MSGPMFLWKTKRGSDIIKYTESIYQLAEMNKKGEGMAEVTTLGLGKTMEKKLHSVGIHSAEELKEIGSKHAFFRLKEKYPGTCVVILYHLEAVIRGCEMKQLEDTCKAELKTYFKNMVSGFEENII